MRYDRRICRFLTIGFAITVCTVLATSAFAQSTTLAPEPSALEANWPLERVGLTNGKVYEGLVVSETPTSVEFLEVRRPRGKPMSLVVRPLQRDDISDLKHITAAEKDQLRERLDRYKRRTLVEGQRMEDLPVTATKNAGQTVWNYDGPWFSLESTANEAMTRRLIVRLGQIFTAYRQLLPPRWPDGRKVHIRIFGSMEQYREALAKTGLAIHNPAVYLANQNLILAGSELDRFEAQLAKVNQRHREIRQQFDKLAEGVPERIKQLGEELKAADIPATERQRILLAEQRKWDDQRKTLLQQIAATDRANAAKFNEVTGRMFTRVAHEAFHAYLESHVYPSRAYDVPRWLNEGLAQTFEAGQLEADTLRIDAPNALALTKLQTDLRSEQPLDLRELLVSGSDAFLGAHRDEGRVSRAYYYSWGLAYYLAFEMHLLDDAALDDYLKPTVAGSDPIARFEKLVGTPLDQFQTNWRAAMLEIDADL